MEKVFHVKCPNIEGEMRITKINASLGNFLRRNDIIATAENRDFILEIRTTISGVLSKIYVKEGTVIFTGELIADLNTTEDLKDDNAQDKINNLSDDISIDEIKNAIRAPYDTRYPNLASAMQKYTGDHERNFTESEDTPQKDFVDEVLKDLNFDDKKKLFSGLLKIFNHKFTPTMNNLSSVEEVNLESLLKTLDLFRSNFQKKYRTPPMIEPFLIKSLNAAIYDDYKFKKDVLNFVLISDSGNVKKSLIKNISKRNFFELQNDINANKGFEEDRDILTIVSNQQSKISFASNKNTVIFNKIDLDAKTAFLTYNMQEISSSSLISNFLTYLENPGWIFFLL